MEHNVNRDGMVVVDGDDVMLVFGWHITFMTHKFSRVPHYEFNSIQKEIKMGKRDEITSHLQFIKLLCNKGFFIKCEPNLIFEQWKIIFLLIHVHFIINFLAERCGIEHTSVLQSVEIISTGNCRFPNDFNPCHTSKIKCRIKPERRSNGVWTVIAPFVSMAQGALLISSISTCLMHGRINENTSLYRLNKMAT